MWLNSRQHKIFFHLNSGCESEQIFPYWISTGKTCTRWGCPRGVMVKAMDSGIIVSEFELQSRYYSHFRINTLGKGMNPLILLAMGKIVPLLLLGCPRGVMVKAMNCGIVVREFVLQSRYYIHFRANTLGKGMNPIILPPAMGK